MILQTIASDEKYNDALSLYRKGDYYNSISILNQLLNDPTRNDISDLELYNFLGINYELTGEYKKALISYNQALNSTIINRNKHYVPAIYLNMAIVYRQLGDYNLAIDYNIKSLNTLEKNYYDYNVLYYYILNNLGEAYQNINSYSISIEYYNQAIHHAKHYKISGVEDTYNNCAQVFHRLGEHSKASDYFLQAVSISEKFNGPNSLQTSIIYRFFGQSLIETYNLEKGKHFLDLSKNIFLKNVGEKHPLISELYNNYGEYYSKSKKYDTALHFLHKALIARLPAFNDTSVFVNPLPSQIAYDITLLDILKNKAHVADMMAKQNKNPGFISLALATYQLSFHVIDNLRAGYLSENSRLDLNRRERETYSALVDFCYGLFLSTGDKTYIETAFTYAERSKYAALLQNINDQQAMRLGGIPDSLTKKELGLREKISAFRRQALDITSSGNPDTVLLHKVNNNLFDALRAREDLVSFLEKNYPRYAQLKFDFRETTVQMVQKKLGKQDALIGYFFSGDTVLYTFVVSRDNNYIYKQGCGPEFYAYAHHFINALQSDYEYPYRHYHEAAYFLWAALIKPLYPQIRDKNLIIVPDGTISYFSFGAMVTSPYQYKGYVDYSTYPYLLYNHTFSYSFSSALMVREKEGRKKWHNTFTGFAPSFKGHKDSLDILPGIEQAMKRHAKLFKGVSYTGLGATETNFREKAPGSDIIQLITHGQHDTLDPLNARLFFEYRGDSHHDGYLYLYEIYNLDLQSGLVVMPSCYSGYGRYNKGEGLESIAQGLQRSGNCPSALISLWSSDLGATVEILDGFYRKLKKGERKDKALRQAKVSYIKESEPLYAHPRYWANLIIIGDNRGMFLHKAFRLAFLVLPFLAIFAYILLRKRNKL